MRRITLDETEIRRLYDGGMSMLRIAEHFGVSKPVIQRRLHADGGDVRSPGEPRKIFLSRELLHELYVVHKFTTTAIADALGVNWRTLSKAMTEHGIEIRPVGNDNRVELNDDELIQRYLDGTNQPELARQFGVSLGLVQKRLSEAGVQCRRSGTRGENHPRWKGGITSETMRIRAGWQCQQWRRAVLQRDNHTCIWCGSTERVEADHIMPFATHVELRFEVSNGRTLCRQCHHGHTSQQHKMGVFK